MTPSGDHRQHRSTPPRYSKPPLLPHYTTHTFTLKATPWRQSPSTTSALTLSCPHSAGGYSSVSHSSFSLSLLLSVSFSSCVLGETPTEPAYAMVLSCVVLCKYFCGAASLAITFLCFARLLFNLSHIPNNLPGNADPSGAANGDSPRPADLVGGWVGEP